MRGRLNKVYKIFDNKGMKASFRSGLRYARNIVFDNVYQFNIRRRYIANYLKYRGATPSPYRLIYVDPNDIYYDQMESDETDWNNRKRKKKVVKKKHGKKAAEQVADLYHPDAARFHIEKNLGKIIGGNWDQNRRPWEERRVYKSIKRAYFYGDDWRETPIFVKRKKILDITGEAYGWDVEDPIGKRISYVEELIERINSEGYLTQAEAENDYRNRNIFHEVSINIGRKGELIWNTSGQHRLAISKLLELDEIPVLVVVRHKKWQEIRYEMYESNSRSDLRPELEQYYNHPDVVDVRPEEDYVH